jgi:hypothetical protein
MAVIVLHFMWDLLKMMASGAANIFDTVIEARKLQADMEARRYIGMYKPNSRTW